MNSAHNASTGPVPRGMVLLPATASTPTPVRAAPRNVRSTGIHDSSGFRLEVPGVRQEEDRRYRRVVPQAAGPGGWLRDG